jgi:hypothetical protein
MAGFRRWMPAALSAALAAACFGLPLSNPDVFWHLSAARWMLAHGAVPRVDWLSWTMSGAPWADFEWLSQLVFQGFHALGGMRGLWVLKFLQLSCAAALLWPILGLYGAAPAARGLGIFLWALGLTTANDLRPEGFSLVFFLALWLLLERRRLRGPSRGPRAEILGCAAFFAFWANLHAGFPYGLLLLALHAAGDARRRRSWTLGYCLLAAAAGALLNPYGTRVYGVLLEHAGAREALSSYIREWQGSSVETPWLWPFWALLAGSFAAALARFLKDRALPFEHLAALLLFALAASGHARMTVYSVTVAIPIAAAALGGFAGSRWLRPALAAVWASGVLFFAVKLAPPLSRPRAFLPDYVPVGLGRFLDAERAPLGRLRLVNPWHWGGYIGWRLAPDYPIFVDGRYIFHERLAPMYAANRSPELYRAWLDGLGAQLVILERTSQLVPMPVTLKDGTKTQLWRPFYLFYLPKRDWALVYWDARASAFVRRAAVRPAWLKEREFSLFRPDDLIAAARMLAEGHATRAALAGEVERFSRWAEPGDAAAARAWLKGLPR